MKPPRTVRSSFLLYLLLAAVALVVTLFFYVYADIGYRSLVKSEARGRITFQEQMLEIYLTEVAGDCLFLAESPLVEEYVRFPGRTELSEALELLLISKPRYRSISYLDDQGRIAAEVRSSAALSEAGRVLSLPKLQKLRLLKPRNLLIELEGSGNSALWGEPLQTPRVLFWMPLAVRQGKRLYLRITVDFAALRELLFPNPRESRFQDYLFASEGQVVVLHGDGSALPDVNTLQQFIGRDGAPRWINRALLSSRRFRFSELNEIGIVTVLSDLYTLVTVLPSSVRQAARMKLLYAHLTWYLVALLLLVPVSVLFAVNKLHKEEAESRLDESIRFQSAMLQTLPDTILRLSPGGSATAVQLHSDSSLLFRSEDLPAGLEELFEEELALKISYYLNLVLDMRREFWFEYRDGTEDESRFFELRFVYSGQSEVILFIRNKTREREQERRLHTTNLFLDAYKSAMDASSLVAKTDSQGRLIYMNEHFRSRFGRSYSDTAGKGLIELMRPDIGELPAHEETSPLDRLMRLSGILRCRGIDDQIYYIDNTLLPINDEQGSLEELISFGHDVTRLEEALALAREAENARSAFIARMSHEMRTPLNCIIGFGEVVNGTEDPRMARRYGAMILDESQNLLDLVNQVLDLSKIEAGKLGIQLKPFDLTALLESVVRSNLVLARRKGLAMKKVHQAGLPRYLIGDPLRLRQVLNNLIGNAVKFTDEGEIVLSAGSTVGEDGIHSLIFEITDTGIGIPEEDQPRIFESFFQVDTGETRRHGGSGLGTTIARQLIELMGGEISFTSRPGEGTRFWFSLDMEESTVAPESRKTLPGEEALQLDLNGQRILIVEDYPPNREVLRLFLQATGATLVSAENGAEALENVAAEQPDLILMDIHMPLLDGYEASAQIRRIEAKRGWNRTPIIGVTADAFRRDIERCYDSGMDRVLIKPIRRQMLLESLAHFFGLLPESIDKSGDRPIEAGSLLSELDGDREAQESLIEGFLEELERQTPVIREAFARENWELLHREVHSVKGGAGNLFAEPLQRAAQALETAAKTRDSAAADEAYPLFLEEVARLREHLVT